MKRIDGRAIDEARPVNITRDFLKNADGSVLFKLGGTEVICAASIENKVPPWLRGKGAGWVTAEYSMLPRATTTRTGREVNKGRPGGRTQEIQRLIGRSLRSVVDLGGLGGEVTIIVDCDVINADGGTRTASITGAFIALYDALSTLRADGKIQELPLSEFVAATSVGIVEGVACLDLNYAEDFSAEVDMNVVMNGSGNIVEIQGTAEKADFSREALDQMLDLAGKGINELIEIQRSILVSKE